ncbi:hypothetical protein CC86DRAFT_405112 [Ophiobolus disseminans]|uniref:Uncharacterized protein n=1 Tax=Ophiobolus disseminans TaxID=1469910 RepID=A0A6A7A5U1_9PLEO|nr:hypothetical protein CC86DRAFT_405112 [Ophiobolus disseminans]
MAFLSAMKPRLSTPSFDRPTGEAERRIVWPLCGAAEFRRRRLLSTGSAAVSHVLLCAVSVLPHHASITLTSLPPA